MSKKKVLLVTQELDPYTAFSEVSVIARQLPQYILEKGMALFNELFCCVFYAFFTPKYNLFEVLNL